MSAMSFREPNEALWRGWRPAHKGTQIVKSGVATNEITIIHTVTTGKVLYLVETILLFAAIATGRGVVYIRDDGDNFWRDVCHICVQINTTVPADHALYIPPLEVPEKYDIVVRSHVAGLTAIGEIFGWEE